MIIYAKISYMSLNKCKQLASALTTKTLGVCHVKTIRCLHSRVITPTGTHTHICRLLKDQIALMSIYVNEVN